MHRKIRGITAWIAMLLLPAACNRDTIVHGVQYDSGGQSILVSALMPSCGCVSLEHVAVTTGADYQGPVEVVGSFHGEEAGSLRLDPGSERRVKFDWAGADNSDRYELQAYRLNVDADPAERGALLGRISNYVRFGEVTDRVSCRESSCDWGDLALNGAWYGPVGQGDVSHVRGASFTSDDQILELNAVRGRCGCIEVRNTSDVSVRLASRRLGRSLGFMALPPNAIARFGFDWAGDSESDVYSITVTPDASVAATATGSQNGVPAAGSPNGGMGTGSRPQTIYGTRAVRVTDYLSTFVESDDETCTGLNGVEIPGAAACPFGELKMYVALRD